MKPLNLLVSKLNFNLKDYWEFTEEYYFQIRKISLLLSVMIEKFLNIQKFSILKLYDWSPFSKNLKDNDYKSDKILN